MSLRPLRESGRRIMGIIMEEGSDHQEKPGGGGWMHHSGFDSADIFRKEQKRQSRGLNRRDRLSAIPPQCGTLYERSGRIPSSALTINFEYSSAKASWLH